MALKLFAHQIPEVARLVWAQECLAQRLEGHERSQVVVALSRSFLIFRLVQGASGISWAVACLQRPGFLELLTTVAGSHSQQDRKRVHASILRKLATKLLRIHRLGNVGGIGDFEGRHAGFSGIHSLSALATAGGAGRAAAALVYAFDRAVIEVLGPGRAALAEILVLAE